MSLSVGLWSQKNSLLGSASSQYYKGPISFLGGGTRCLNIDLCPDLLLAAAAAAGAGIFVALWQAISVAGRRRKRRQAGLQVSPAENSWGNYMWNIFYVGIANNDLNRFKYNQPVVTLKDKPDHLFC